MKCRHKPGILQTRHELLPINTGAIRCLAQPLRGSTTTKKVIFPNTQSPARWCKIPPGFSTTQNPRSPASLALPPSGPDVSPYTPPRRLSPRPKPMDATTTLRPRRSLRFQSPSTPVLQRLGHFRPSLSGAHVATPPHRDHRRTGNAPQRHPRHACATRGAPHSTPPRPLCPGR